MTGAPLLQVTDTAAQISVLKPFAVAWLERRMYGQISKEIKKRADIALLVVGLGIDIIFFVLGVWPMTMPAWAVYSGLGAGALLGLGGVMLFFSSKNNPNEAEGLSQEDSPHAQQQSASGAGRDILQAGRDIVLGQQTAPQVLQPWLRRPGAPRFRMHPGINPPRQLLNRFEMQADVTPADSKHGGLGPASIWILWHRCVKTHLTSIG
jgi:hypothetical protein